MKIKKSSEHPGGVTESETNLISEEAKSRLEQDREIMVGRLQQLFERADQSDQAKEGSASPFIREELYAERLDRFR